MPTLTDATNERTEIKTTSRLHVEERPADNNYRLTTGRGSLLFECQTLNLNGEHPTHLPPGTEIGSHPGEEITLVYDPRLSRNGHVWIFLP